MADIVLVTGRDLQRPEEETPLVVAALDQMGISATIEPWGSAESLRAPLVVIRTTWDYTAHYEEFLEWARTTAGMTTLVNPFEIVVWNSHKSYLVDLAGAGVPVVETAIVAKGATADEQRAALARHDGQIVIKPAVSAGAIGVRRSPAASETAASHLAGLVTTGDVLVQPFQPGVLDGEVSLVYLGGRFSHAVHKKPAAGDYRVQVMHGGIESVVEPTSAQREVAEVALSAVDGELAYARVDLVDTIDGPRLMELELVEPQLFLDMDPDAPARLAAHLADRLASTATGVGHACTDR